jgi:hypothetical protein
MRIGDMAETGNPILYVEDLRRLPLRRRRTPVPGAIFVYRSRGGRLSTPQGGYTAGELWWRGPQVEYEIDMARHPLALVLPADNLSGVRASVEVTALWRVRDPSAIIANRITDAARLFRVVIQGHIGGAFDGWASLPDLAVAMRRALPREMQLPEGLSIEDIDAHILSGTTDERLMRELLADEALAGGDEPDLLTAWRQTSELANAALRAARAEEEIADEERDSVISAALQRFYGLVTRLGNHLSKEDRRSE